MSLWQWIQALALLLFAVVVVQVIVAYAWARLRLVDWFGWIWIIAGAIAIPGLLWAISPWLLAGLPLSIGLGLFWARNAVAEWRAGAEPGPTGIFVVGEPTPGVRNWVRS